MRAWAVVLSVVVLLAWVWFVITPEPTPPMGFEDEVEQWRMLEVAALTMCSLFAVGALLANRRA